MVLFMKKLLLTVLILIVNFFTLNAQNKIENSCATDEIHLKSLKENPEYKQKFERETILWQEYAKKHEVETKTTNKSVTLTAPVTLTVDLSGAMEACQNIQNTYTIVDVNGALVTGMDWIVNGPSGYSQTGSNNPFDIAFPTAGNYVFSNNGTTSNFCASLITIHVIETPATPTVITGPLVICPNIPQTYTCNNLDPGNILNWSVTNGTIIGNNTGNTISVKFDQYATSYNVNVWQQGSSCNSDVYTINITKDIPVFSITSANTTICGSTTESYHTTYSAGENYVWSVVPPTAGSIQTGQNTPNISVLWNQASGLATVNLRIRKCGGIFQQTFVVNIVNHPNINIIAPTTACVNQSFATAFTMSFGTTFQNVTWDFGDGSVPIVKNATDANPFGANHTYPDPLGSSTTYTITVTVTGANGCLMPAIAHFPIIVSPSPIVTITPTNNLYLCNQTNPSEYLYSVNLQGGFSPTDSIQWYHDGSPIIGETNATINVQFTGVGIYYATVTNSFGCISKTNSFSVQSCGTGNACSLGYNMTAVAQNNGCQGVHAQATLIEGSPTNVTWGSTNLTNATVTANTPYYFDAVNITPGFYNLTLNATYDNAGTYCVESIDVPFTIPYKPGLKYTVDCTGAGNYTVTLLDHSVYYPLTPIQNFAFSTDNGLNWYPATITSGIAQFTTTLNPGTYQVGIRISGSGYTACQEFIPLVLPAMPVATFHLDPANTYCKECPVQFIADDTTPGLQYDWHFDGIVHNLQQNPVRAYATSGSKHPTLTVINKYGCMTTWGTAITINDFKLDGKLKVVPSADCVGGSLSLVYTPDFGQQMPTHFVWYHDNVTAIPFATTTVPTITVTQSGQYFVYVSNNNGCNEYTNPAASVAFIPLPLAPTVTGTTIACTGSPIMLSVPPSANVQYVWTRNGIPEPLWDGATSITDVQTTAATYTYGVTAQIINPSGGFCSSPQATFTVNVVNEPGMPLLQIDLITCNPYRYKVTVINPQLGVNYYWSNGAIGETTTITHDSPIQVRAEVFGCSVTAQTDLPRDLTAIAWTFPDGCYTKCDRQPFGYVTNPLGDFNEWSWIENGSVVVNGHNSIPDFSLLNLGHNYQLMVDNGYCSTRLSNISVETIRCNTCDFKYTVTNITQVEIGGIPLFEITLVITNPTPLIWTSTMSVPNGEGYFDSSIILLPLGTSTHTVYFYPINGYSGGTHVLVNINGHIRESDCLMDLDIRFPLLTHKNSTESGNSLDVKNNLLLLVPNPATEGTLIIYNYSNDNNPYTVQENATTEIKTIEIYDQIGRKLITLPIREPKGSVMLDTSHYASGQYLVLMKEHNNLIKNAKLIVKQ